MISGRQGLVSIEAALREIERAESEARHLAERETDTKAKMEGTIAGGYRDLARFKVDVSLEDGIIDRADGLSGTVVEHLTRWQTTYRATESKWAALKSEIEIWRKKRSATHEEVDQARALYDRAFAKAKETLEADKSHAALVKAHADAVSHIDNARAKAEKAEAERADKEKPYAADPLFMYLWNRKFGTAEYQANALTRTLDGWVARLIGYHEARANFAALMEIPVRLNQYVTRLALSAEKAEAAIAANVQREVVRTAKRDVVAQITELEAKLAELETEVTKREAAFDALSDELTRLAQGADPSFEAALDELSNLLSSTSFRQLVADAKRTRSEKDDQIIERIQSVTTNLEQIEDTLSDHRKQLDALSARRSDLLRIAAEFRRQRYDDSSSVFATGDVFDTLLRQLLTGAISAGHYWSELQRRQNWQRRASDRVPRYDEVILDPRGGMSWPRFPPGGFGGGVSFPGGGGSGGGISVPRGGIGGGRFRTGGTF